MRRAEADKDSDPRGMRRDSALDLALRGRLQGYCKYGY
jgi:hypothetical protein